MSCDNVVICFMLSDLLVVPLSGWWGCNKNTWRSFVLVAATSIFTLVLTWGLVTDLNVVLLHKFVNLFSFQYYLLFEAIDKLGELQKTLSLEHQLECCKLTESLFFSNEGATSLTVLSTRTPPTSRKHFLSPSTFLRASSTKLQVIMLGLVIMEVSRCLTRVHSDHSPVRRLWLWYYAVLVGVDWTQRQSVLAMDLSWLPQQVWWKVLQKTWPKEGIPNWRKDQNTR